ncbi:MAG: hypothetical protein E7053_02330 [Lentisphaerae bacterium]|nr:hypothetical protein [Lentisphaerota bacterium]
MRKIFTSIFTAVFAAVTVAFAAENEPQTAPTAGDSEKIRVYVSYGYNATVQIKKGNTILFSTEGRYIYFSKISHGINKCEWIRAAQSDPFVPGDPNPEDEVLDIDSLLCAADNSGLCRYLIVSAHNFGSGADAGYTQTTIFDISGNCWREVVSFSAIGLFDPTNNICGCRHPQKGLWFKWTDEIYYAGAVGAVYLNVTMGFDTTGWEKEIHYSNLSGEKIFSDTPPQSTDWQQIRERKFVELAAFLAVRGRLKELREMALRYNFTEEEIANWTIMFCNDISSAPYGGHLLRKSYTPPSPF